MTDAPTTRRTRWAAAAGVLGAVTAVAALSGAGSAPGALQLASSSPTDISGNCDEAEHANDVECGGTGAVDGSTSTTVDDSTSTTLDDSTSTTVGNPGGPVDEIRTIDADGAGIVIVAVEGGSLRLVAATPSPGWQVEVERGVGPEVEVDFRSGTKRVQVNVELEDGQVRERVRARDDASDDRDDSGSGSSGSSDDSVDDDHSGSGHGGDDDADDSDDDHSGSGHGGDDDADDSDDDHGGHSSDD